MRLHDILNEVHYRDIFPKQFEVFRQQYEPPVRAGEDKDLWVQFSNYADNTLDKRAFTDPDHHDPVGVYGYPLAYVIDHPADIWYGQTAKYLRVLRATPSNPLVLQDIRTEEQALEILGRIPMKEKGYHWHPYPAQPQEFLNLALKRIDKGSPSKWAKALMCVIQNKLQYHEKTTSFTGVEQTRRLRQAGFDTVIDLSTRSRDAVINAREPEQGIFLTRSSFRIEKVFPLRPDADPEDTLVFADSQNATRKLASLIADRIGDALEGEGRTDFRFDSHFRTRRGRHLMIKVGFSRSDPNDTSYKPHRLAGTDTTEPVTVKFTSEAGEIEQTYPAELSFAEMAEDVAGRFADLQASGASDATFQPQTTWDMMAPEAEETFAAWKALARSYKIAWGPLSPKGKMLLHTVTKDVIDRALHGTWAKNRKPKPDLFWPQVETFWRQQRATPPHVAAMVQILTKAAKDRTIPANETNSVHAMALAKSEWIWHPTKTYRKILKPDPVEPEHSHEISGTAGGSGRVGALP